MTGIMCKFSDDIDKALKLYSIEHGIKSKSEAAAELIEQWLKEHGYLDPESSYGYENLE